MPSENLPVAKRISSTEFCRIVVMMMSFENRQASIEEQGAENGGLKPPEIRPGTKNNYWKQSS